MNESKRNRFVYLAAFFFSAALVFSSFAIGYAEQQGPVQKMCPVMGGEINKEVFVDHKGNRVYFCCPGCIDKFKNDPDKYMNKMGREGTVLEKVLPAKGQCQETNRSKCSGKHKCSSNCADHKR